MIAPFKSIKVSSCPDILTTDICTGLNPVILTGPEVGFGVIAHWVISFLERPELSILNSTVCIQSQVSVISSRYVPGLDIIIV